MKLVIILVCLVFLPMGATAQGQGGNAPADLSLSLEYRETSKDSNSRLMTAEIRDGVLRLTRENGGYPDPDKETREIILEDDAWPLIREYMRDHGIEGRMVEEKPVEGPGVAGFLTLEIAGEPGVRVRIAGKRNIWGSDDYVRDKWGQEYVASRTNLEHADWFGRTEALFLFLWNL